MGYSVACPIRSWKAHKNMRAFLEKHYTGHDHSDGRFRLKFDNFSYHNGKLAIGFDYSGATDEQHAHMWGMLYWIASKGI